MKARGKRKLKLECKQCNLWFIFFLSNRT